MKVNSESIFAALVQDLGQTAPFLTSDMSVKDAAKFSLRASLFKKLEPDTPCLIRAARGIELWYEMNERCRTSFKEPDGSEYVDDILFTYRDLMHRSLDAWDGPLLTWASCFDSGRHGPGVSAGVRHKDFFAKSFASTLTASSDRVYAMYLSLLRDRWRTAEKQRVTTHGRVANVPAGLFTVPKNVEIDRVACKEPSLNMFFQLGAGKVFQSILWKDHRIDLSHQPQVNRRLAQIGSLNGSYATIDLKSASDTISHAFVKWSLDSRSFRILDDMRSHRVQQKERGTTEIHMFSSMGNGFTFPLQTLIFANVVKAAYIHLGLALCEPGTDIRTYSVFGDDIVCRREAYEVVCTLLSRCGFIVNSEKSYNVGPFRESCGQDFFLGKNIRGIYIKSLSNEQDIYSAFNRLLRWSIRNGISVIRTLKHLKGLAKFQPVPFDAGDDAGFHWPSSFTTNRKRDSNGALYYWASRYEKSRRRVRVDQNPHGALIAFLYGGLTCINDTAWLPHLEAGRAVPSGGRRKTRTRAKFFVNIPSEERVTKIVRESSSSWDWIPYVGVTLRDYLNQVVALEIVNL